MFTNGSFLATHVYKQFIFTRADGFWTVVFKDCMSYLPAWAGWTPLVDRSANAH